MERRIERSLFHVQMPTSVTIPPFTVAPGTVHCAPILMRCEPAATTSVLTPVNLTGHASSRKHGAAANRHIVHHEVVQDAAADVRVADKSIDLVTSSRPACVVTRCSVTKDSMVWLSDWANAAPDTAVTNNTAMPAFISNFVKNVFLVFIVCFLVRYIGNPAKKTT